MFYFERLNPLYIPNSIYTEGSEYDRQELEPLKSGRNIFSFQSAVVHHNWHIQVTYFFPIHELKLSGTKMDCSTVVDWFLFPNLDILLTLISFPMHVSPLEGGPLEDIIFR